MKTRDTNKLVMFLLLSAFCAEAKNKEAVGHLDPFLESWDAFLSLVNRLRKRSLGLLKLNPGGAAENGQALREALAKRTAAVSAALVTWARKTGNAAVAEQAYVTKTMLLNGRAIDAAERSEHLAELANEHLEDLSAYKITKRSLTELDDLISEFSESIGRPRAIVKARKQARKLLPELFALADVELGHMDRLLALLEDDYEEFVRGFRANRKIDQVPASRALSELEKASAAERAAKLELAKAKKAVVIADKHTQAETTLAKARAIHPGTTTAQGANLAKPSLSNRDVGATASDAEDSGVALGG